EALAAARAKERKAIYRWAADISQSDDPLTVVDRMWDWMTSKRTERFMRLFFEVYGLSLTDPTRLPEFIERSVTEWLTLIEPWLVSHGLPPARAAEMATSQVGACRGLLLDLLATGDTKRVQRGYRLLRGYWAREMER